MTVQQERDDVLRQRPRDRAGRLRVDGRGGEVDGEGDGREGDDCGAHPAAAVQQQQAEERDQRDEVARADGEAAFPSVEADVEGEEEPDDGEDAPIARHRNGHEQNGGKEEETAVRRDGDSEEGLQRRRDEDTAVGEETRVLSGHRRRERAAEADPLIRSEREERGGSGNRKAGQRAHAVRPYRGGW